MVWISSCILVLREEARKMGSEQEFDKRPISRGSPEKHEFGFGDGHALRLEQQVA